MPSSQQALWCLPQPPIFVECARFDLPVQDVVDVQDELELVPQHEARMVLVVLVLVVVVLSVLCPVLLSVACSLLSLADPVLILFTANRSFVLLT